MSKFHGICLTTTKKHQSNLKRLNFDTNQIPVRAQALGGSCRILSASTFESSGRFTRYFNFKPDEKSSQEQLH